MTQLLTLMAPGTLGVDVGEDSAGMVVGKAAQADMDHVLSEFQAQDCLCFTDDGGLFVDETTPANEATGDDVELVGATIAVNDAIYFGHATATFSALDINITTQGDYTTTTFAWEYWNGTAWTALSGVTDGTSNFEAGTGVVEVSFTIPTDWAQNTVAAATEGYWVRARCTATNGTTTPCQMGQIWVTNALANAVFVDETADASDAGADDVELLSDNAKDGDRLYFGMTSRFGAVKINMGVQGSHNLTLVWEYWDGDSWETLTVNDQSTSFEAGTSTYMVTFVPPTDWTSTTTANGPDSKAAYFIRARIDTFTSMTTAPFATQIWGYPITAAGTGILMPANGTITRAGMNAGTASAGNADCVFLILNLTQGLVTSFTWTGGELVDQDSNPNMGVAAGDEVAIQQVQEDAAGQELVDAVFYLTLTN